MRYLLLIIFILTSSPAFGEPLPRASFKKACASQSIVVAKYIGYRKKSFLGSIGYFDPPIAKYLVIRKVFGEKTAEEIEVRYDFHDGSPCIEEQDWKFSELLMPKEDSKWVLFLTSNTKGVYTTYHGDFGRVPVGSLSNFFIGQCNKHWTKQ